MCVILGVFVYKKAMLTLSLLIVSNMTFGFREILGNCDDVGIGFTTEPRRELDRQSVDFNQFGTCLSVNYKTGINGSLGMFGVGVWGWASPRVCTAVAIVLASYLAYQKYFLKNEPMSNEQDTMQAE